MENLYNTNKNTYILLENTHKTTHEYML